MPASEIQRGSSLLPSVACGLGRGANARERQWLMFQEGPKERRVMHVQVELLECSPDFILLV